MERRGRMRIVEFYCKKCKGSMHMSYGMTGDKNRQVMDGMIIKCARCKKVIIMKKCTEGMIERNTDTNNKLYL